jgi:hypothetical protein
MYVRLNSCNRRARRNAQQTLARLEVFVLTSRQDLNTASDEQILAALAPKMSNPITTYRGIKIQHLPFQGYAWPNAGWFKTLAECQADIDSEMDSGEWIGPSEPKEAQS